MKTLRVAAIILAGFILLGWLVWHFSPIIYALRLAVEVS